MIEGPKWCGKTTTAEQIAASILYMADPEREKQNLTMAEISPGRLLKGEIALEQAFDYYDAVVISDISRADGVARNPERVKCLMLSYARNQGSQAANTLIKDDIWVNDVESLDTDTVYS